ncbi:hypothetical protein C2G38_2224048 [Gigaspora rosea]|uniref:Uncharacterized protein n=1 Tax=Gigaspora rosea TaxID=44941 RepID=A0A397U4W7_9GLOM|nr:hypothetical protein C2G38_2224048 [Gigaspora rosea]
MPQEKSNSFIKQNASHHFAFAWDLFLDYQKENKKEEKIEEITNDEFEEFINY